GPEININTEEAVNDTESSEEVVVEVLSKSENDMQKKIDDLSKEVEKYKELSEENYKRFQYSMADLENLKRRTIQDRNEMRKYGIIPFAREILNVVDNLERALEHLETADKDTLTKGIKMTLDMFNGALTKHGITPIAALGKFFDPNVHEGFLMVETNNYAPNSVIDELERGYMLEGRLLRPSKVSVSVAPKGNQQEVSNDKEAVSEEATEEVEIN
ncbi:nucleotide exchange factor GrpE, partial [Thermodesulfobacteriota bacterium]